MFEIVSDEMSICVFVCVHAKWGREAAIRFNLNLQIIGCFEPMSRDYLATKGHNSKILNRHRAKIYFTSDFSQRRSLMRNVCLLVKKILVSISYSLV